MGGDTRRTRSRIIALIGIGTSMTLLAFALLAVVLVLLTLGGKQLADQLTCDRASTELIDPVGASVTGRASIPARFVATYVTAASRFKLGSDGWLWLAAIHKVETDFSRNAVTSSAGARGPMQFMPDTWRTLGVDGDGDGRAEIINDTDAIHGAANYLRASGAPRDWHRAVFAYNHAEWYYRRVLGFQMSYRGSGADAVPDLPQPDTRPGPAETGAAQSIAAEGPQRVAEGRRGQVAFAVADAHAQILISFRGQQAFPSASLTKAMLMVAQLRQLRDRPVPADISRTLRAMITTSDNASANAIWRSVRSSGVHAVARAAGMLDFRLRTGDPVYRLGNSRVTADDQARLFARIDALLPSAHRAYGMSLLAGIVPSQRWGIWQAGFSGPLYAKAGWRPDASGNVVNQAAQVLIGGRVRGLAILSQGPGESYGRNTIQLIAAALNDPGTPTTVELAPGSGCAPADTLPGASLAVTPGGRARLTAEGLAVAPQEAPAQVKAILAAGNQIVGRPYTYGGGHGPPLSRPVRSYDCSSSISYILFQAALFPAPTAWVSGAFASGYGEAGIGRWVTLRANAGHMYMYVAGLRWDTHRWGAADRGVPGVGWHTAQRPDTGFTARHPSSL